MQPYGPAVLRLVIGAIFVAHGAQKLFGIWGGGGIEGTTAFFTQLGLGPAMPLAILVGTVEFVGGLMLVGGALTVVACLALTIEMLVATFKVHLAGGFFLPTGYEFNNATEVLCNSIDGGAGIGTGTGQVNSNLCNSSTLASTDTKRTMWADRIYPTPLTHRLFGEYAHNRIKERW